MKNSLLWPFLLLAMATRLSAFDHTYAQYQAVLDRHVRDGQVDYQALSLDRAALDSFITACGEIPFEHYRAFTKNEQLAFMINLFNAGTMKLLIDHWPVGSIQEIGGFFSSPWNERFILLFGHTVSLGQIEHDILRADFKDPRIHFAIVSGSAGSPALPSQAYMDRMLARQLADAENSFLTGRPNENRFENGKLYVSPLFKWYREDFNGEEGIRTLFQLYYPEVTKDTRIVYTDYDWSVNSCQVPDSSNGVGQ